MPVAHVIMGLLATEPLHGYELKRAHDRRLPGAKPLGFGQVYATLGRLERDGLIRSRKRDRAGGPERTWYDLTDGGRRALRDWLARVEPPAPHLTSTLLTKVVVALLAADADTARGYLAAQRAAHVARLRELTRAKTDPAAAIGDVIAADYTIAHLDADLRWLDATLARVAELDGELRR